MKKSLLIPFSLMAILSLSCKSSGGNQLQSAIKDDANITGEGGDPKDCSFSHDTDPFDPKASFTYTENGVSHTRCLDTREARPIVKIDQDTVAKYGLSYDNDHYYIANVYHKQHHYIAKIPKAVALVIFGIEHFPAPVPAGHGFLRLEFDSPVSMVPQIPGDTVKPFETKRLVLSMEALGEVGWKYDLVKGLNNRFRGVWRVETLSSAYSDFVVKYQHLTEQIKLSLDKYPEERAEILRIWIETSNSNGSDQWYNTVTSSCGLDAFKVINQARTNMHQNDRSLIGNLIRMKTDIYFPGEIDPPLAKRALAASFLYAQDYYSLNSDKVLIGQLNEELNLP